MKEKGAKLILSGTKQNILNELSSELGADTKAIATDLTSKESILSLVTEAESTFGHIDILINNAGITADNLFLRMKDEEWENVININSVSYTHLTLPTR